MIFSQVKTWIAAGAVGTIMVLGAGWYISNERLIAARAELTVSRANVAALEAAVARQNAAVAALGAKSKARQASVAKAIEAAPVARPRVLEALSAPARGDTITDRVEDIDRRFLGALQ